MVATVTPSAAPAINLEPRARDMLRPAAERDSPPQNLDTVAAEAEGPAALWRAARENLRQGLADLDLSLATGQEALKLLNEVGEAARGGDDAALKAALNQYRETIDGAVAHGAALLAGANLHVQTELEAPTVDVAGLDLRLKAEAGDVVQLTSDSNAATPEAAAASAKAAQESASRVQAGLDRLRVAAQRLEAHDGFLAAVEASVSSGVRGDLDADSARLLALQVRQDLTLSGGAIANARPDSVLGLFRG